MHLNSSPRLLLILPALGAALLQACADTRGGSIPYDKVLAAPDEVRFQTLESNYRIAPMDKLAVKVFKMDDLSGDYDVDLAGNISLPLIGQVQAANLTTAQLDDQLTQKLGAKYLEHPDVSVAIKASTAHVLRDRAAKGIPANLAGCGVNGGHNPWDPAGWASGRKWRSRNALVPL